MEPVDPMREIGLAPSHFFACPGEGGTARPGQAGGTEGVEQRGERGWKDRLRLVADGTAARGRMDVRKVRRQSDAVGGIYPLMRALLSVHIRRVAECVPHSVNGDRHPVTVDSQILYSRAHIVRSEMKQKH